MGIEIRQLGQVAGFDQPHCQQIAEYFTSQTRPAYETADAFPDLTPN